MIPRKFSDSGFPPLNIGTIMPSPQLCGKMPSENSLLYKDNRNGEIMSKEFLKTSAIKLSLPGLLEFFCSKTAFLISFSRKGESNSQSYNILNCDSLLSVWVFSVCVPYNVLKCTYISLIEISGSLTFVLYCAFTFLQNDF